MDQVADQLETARNAIVDCDYEKAVAACREVLSRHPRHVEATCLLAEAYREQGQRTLVAEAPRRLDVWVALAEVLWRGGSHEEAAEVCEAILAESPHCIKALIILAKIRQVEGESKAAHHLLALAKELDPAGSTLAKLS